LIRGSGGVIISDGYISVVDSVVDDVVAGGVVVGEG